MSDSDDGSPHLGGLASSVTNSFAAKAGGSLTPSQARSIHIVAVVCAGVSFVAVLLALRWFMLMRRSFRHHLVMLLIMTDTIKGLIYLVFPIVTFATGPVPNESKFCQVSGFFLAFSIEASDMAILVIAIHSVLYIMKPNNNGEGGIYPYRQWVYPLWFSLPLLAASLAFINSKHGYVTSGTFCYLPKRPFWYRLTLSWVPRYFIIFLIISMYIWIYVYVHIKFRGFENLGSDNPSYESASEDEARRKSCLSTSHQDMEHSASVEPTESVPKMPPGMRPISWLPEMQSSAAVQTPPTQPTEPWDQVDFITTRHLKGSASEPNGGTTTNSGSRLFGSAWSGSTQVQPNASGATKTETGSGFSRSPSDGPSIGSKDAGNSQTDSENKPDRVISLGRDNDPMRDTRIAIRKQLRYLFIYPAVYVVMWTFPFAAHALNYNTYRVQHPIYWLTVVQVMCLSLQAGVDSVLFSWREKPWRKIDDASKLSVPFMHRLGKKFVRKHVSCAKNAVQPQSTVSTPAVTEEKAQAPKRTIKNWWDVEARRRGDSVFVDAGESESIAPVVTRTRSQSTEKPASMRDRLLHVRTRSTSKSPPKPAPLPSSIAEDEALTITTPIEAASSYQQATMGPVSPRTASGGRGQRSSLQETRSKPLEKLERVESNDTT